MKKTFRVLGIRAPATHWGDKVAYPGDPTCLMYALTPTLDRLMDDGTIFDLAQPEMVELFAPVVWDEAARAELDRQLADEPRVVLISTTSPAAPYAFEILKIVRSASEAITVLGGPHADELLNPISCNHPHLDSRWRDLVDVAVSGDGGLVITRLLEIIADEVGRGRANRSALLRALMAAVCHPTPVFRTLAGVATITVRTAQGYALARTSGRTITPTEYGLPYRHFAPAARFDCFDGVVTGHLMTTFGCSYRCNFCSEGGNFRTARPDALSDLGMKAMQSAVAHGAEAAFFDDAIMFGGSFAALDAFSTRIEKDAPIRWGGQLTFPTILRDRERARESLRRARECSLTYLYCGLESASPRVMGSVAKAQRTESWHTAGRTAFETMRSAGIPQIGTSVLFGLPGETDETVDETINFVGKLAKSGLIDRASPNLVTYHPGTPLTRAENMRERLDFTKMPSVELPYSLFEEADPQHVRMANMPLERIWRIVRALPDAWGAALISADRFRAAVTTQ